MDNKAVYVIGLEKFTHFTRDLIHKMGREAECTRPIAAYMESSTKRKLQTGKIRGPKTSAFTLSLRRGKGGGLSLVDNAQLLQSIEHTDNAVGSDLIYAAIHNTGGIIRPKRASFLAIPATKETKSLAALKGCRGTIEYLRKKGYTIWFAGKTILGKPGPRSKVRVLFFLKKQVEIPQQEFLYIDETDENVIREVLTKWLKS